MAGFCNEGVHNMPEAQRMRRAWWAGAKWRRRYGPGWRRETSYDTDACVIR